MKPRDRVPPGSHPNWCHCQGCRRDIAQFEANQWKGTLIAAAVVIILAGLWGLVHAFVTALH